MKKQWLAIPLGGIIVATMLVAFPAVGTTLAAIVTCGSTAPCDGGSNTSTGPGVQGSSTKGNGLYGTTTSATANAGVFGKDLTTLNKNNVGVQGTSKNGSGVYGVSTSGTGIKGTSDAVGVDGRSTGYGSIGVHGYGTTGISGDASDPGYTGIGISGNGFTGIQATSTAYDCFASTCPTALYASGNYDGIVAFGNEDGVYAQAIGYGVTASSAYDAVTGANQGGTSGTAVLGQGNTPTGFLFRGNNEYNVDVFKVDDSGNGYFHGQVSATKFVTHAAASVQQATSTGANVTTFSSQVTQADVEHIGEADLVGGVATVHFDPSFAAILAHGHYMVFLTPQGPTQGGLYVSQKSPGGFVVRSENPSARSNVAFDYRVVGRPYSTQLNTGTDTLQRNTPAGPIHGPVMTRVKFPDFRHKLRKPNKALPVIK